MRRKNVAAWTTMLTTFAKSGQLARAKLLFDLMPQRDLVAWNALISANVLHDQLEEALSLFRQAPEQNVVTWTAMIHAYANRSLLEEAQNLFNMMRGRNAVTWTTMMLAYADNGLLQSCLRFFRRMPSWDLVACTAMVEFYSQNNLVKEAASLFDRMDNRNLVTWIALLAAYCQTGDFQRALEVFELFPCRCVVSVSVMITGLGQNGELEAAKRLFHSLPEKDVGAWNSLLAAAAGNGESSLALSLFKLMDLEGIQPDKLTYLSTLEACAQIPSLPDVGLLHKTIPDELLLDTDVKTSLLTLYSRCGAVEHSLELFNEISFKDSVCWSSMITAYSQNGLPLEALRASHEMVLEGFEPQQMTFVSILAACSHAGLCKQGITWFVLMSGDFGVAPGIDHYKCMVDLFGRAGYVRDAADLALNMPFEPDSATWRSYLAARKVHESCNKPGFQSSIIGPGFDEFVGDDAATYILLSQQ